MATRIPQPGIQSANMVIKQLGFAPERYLLLKSPCLCHWELVSYSR